MSKDDRLVFGFGILCLIGGILFAYFGYFAPPYLLLTTGYPLGIVELLAPFLFILLGGLIVFGGILYKFTPAKKKTKGTSSPLLPPPPPPANVTTRICPTCGQPLAFIQQYSRWYCANCKKYP